MYEYRTRQPIVEVSPVQEEHAVPFQPLRLRPPIRPLITPPAMRLEALKPVLQPETPPQQLAEPFFTGIPVVAASQPETPATAPVIKPSVEEKQPVADTAEKKTLVAEVTKPAEKIEERAKAASLPETPAAAVAAVPVHADMTIAFEKNSSTLTPEAGKSLDAIIRQLNDLPDTRLQIRAYASDGEDGQSSARRMSLSRALIVRSYMSEKGIKPIRLDVRALGPDTDKTPVDRVDLVFVR